MCKCVSMLLYLLRTLTLHSFQNQCRHFCIIHLLCPHGSSFSPLFFSIFPFSHPCLFLYSSDSSQSSWFPYLLFLFSYFSHPNHLPVYMPLPFLSRFFLFYPCHSFNQMSEIKNELDTLPMRAMLAAAFITYLSAAPEDRRRHLLETWMAQSGLESKYTIQANMPVPAYANSHTK